MKIKGKVEQATPLLEREEADHYRLSLTGLPKGKHVAVVVTYDDAIDAIRYEIGESPDGTLEHTFPIVGTGGQARVFVSDTDKDGNVRSDTAKLLGTPITID